MDFKEYLRKNEISIREKLKEYKDKTINFPLSASFTLADLERLKVMYCYLMEEKTVTDKEFKEMLSGITMVNYRVTASKFKREDGLASELREHGPVSVAYMIAHDIKMKDIDKRLERHIKKAIKEERER